VFRTHFAQLSLQVTSVIPSAASLGNLNNVWGGSPRILGTGVSFSLSLSWLLPPRALAIKQIRVSPAVVPGLVPTSVYINRSTQLCLFSSLKLMYAVVLIFASACIFLRAQTALQPFSTSKDYCSRSPRQHRVCKFFFTGFQSLFADLYMVFNFTRQISGVVIEYSNGTSWVSVPTAAMRPLSCSPGTSVFSDPSRAPLVHSCRCPFDRQIPAQPMCRSVRKWRCKYVTFVHLLLSLCDRALL
jgi:hypothetical protein